MTFANVASVSVSAGNTVINMSNLTGSYDIINNGEYSNNTCKLIDIVYAGDKILVANNTEKIVSSVNGSANTITLTTPLSNSAISFLSVRRTISTNDVRLDGFVGTVYYPSLTTEDGAVLVTENDEVILLG